MRVLDTHTSIAPFGDLVGDLPCLGRTFAERRSHEVEKSGVDPDRITMRDNAFCSAPILAAFAARANGPSALAVGDDSVFAVYAGASSVRREDGLLIYDVFCDVNATDVDAARAEAKPVRIDVSPVLRRRELPRLGPPPHHFDVVDDGQLVLHVDTWAHVLWLWPTLVRRIGRGPKRNVIGKNVDIHPSAFVEGSVIGDDVEISAGCSVRHSYVGAKSKLSDFTNVAYSVLEAEIHTLADATFSEMVALGGGTLTSLLFKDSILGKNVFLTTGVIFWTDVLEGNVEIDVDGTLVDSGRRMLGGCAGHGSVLGARTILAPGRALPNRTTVVMRKEEGVFAIDDAEPGTPMCWHEGALVPVSVVAPDYTPEEIS